MTAQEGNDPTDQQVIITAGEFAGQKGICLGASAGPGLYAVTPNTSNRVLQLLLNTEFVVYHDTRGQPAHCR
jgi:hypothetical protein